MDITSLVRLPLTPVTLLAQMAHDLHELRCNLEPLPDVLDRLDGRVARLDARVSVLGDRLDEVGRDVRLARQNVDPMDDDLAEVTVAIREIGPQMGSMRDELVKLRDDLGGLPFVGR